MSYLLKDRVSPESEAHGFRHLQDVLESNLFKNAPVLSGLLLYLWQNRANDISEYAIAVEALGRKPDFESKIDATVRVQISRLRKLLEKYYKFEGISSPSRLVIPLGAHKIRLIEVSPASEPNGDSKGSVAGMGAQTGGTDSEEFGPHDEEPRPALSRLLVPTMGTTIVLLLVCIGVLLWSPFHQRSQNSVSTSPQVPAFWKMFSDNGKPIRLVLPAPLFFAWSSPDGVFVRDININDAAKYEDSAQIGGLAKHLGKPTTWSGYTVLSDTFGALKLARFLDSYGIEYSISSSVESPQGIIEHENIVAFGTTTSLGIYQSEIDRLSYTLEPHQTYVIDKRLPPGSPVQFPMQRESAARRSVEPGLVAFLPRGSSDSRILILQGARTVALISWLISDEGMREIAAAQAAQGNGPYFEAVVLCEVNGETPIQSRMVAFRPVSAKGR